MGTKTERTIALVGALVVDFAIQWVGWAVACLLKSERFYDALGSATFLTLSLASLGYGASFYPRQIVVTVMVSLWALRLGSFLIYRVHVTGGDSRFDEAKHKPGVFFVYWTMQGVWVWVTVQPLLLLNSDDANPGLQWTDVVGVALWALGFLCESAADWQKFAFKRDPANKGHFIDTGLWHFARYPNYFGEMLCWWGVWLASAAVFSGSEWASVASPAFVMLLLLFVSGIPLQERQAQERWGSDPAYQEYRRRTWLLLPLPKLCHSKAS